MKIILTTLGSWGDTLSMLALAGELRLHGHQCTLALAYDSVQLAREFKFHTVQLGPDERLPDQSALESAAPAIFQKMMALCNEADLLISSVWMPLGKIIHELTKIPYVSVQPDYPAQMKGIPGLFAKGEHEELLACHGISKKSLNLFREMLGLPQVERLELHGVSSQLMLLPISHEVLEPDPDWPEHYHVTGSFFIERQDWEPDPQLLKFLQTGSPPVLFTSSTSAGVHSYPSGTIELFIATATEMGCRTIIQDGRTGPVEDTKYPPHIHVTGFLPHHWILPQTLAVVYHGGVGTCAASLKAGVPSVIVPYYNEGFAIGHRMKQRGISEVIPAESLTGMSLRSSLSRVINEPQYRHAAQEASQRIQSEQGVAVARHLITRFYRNLQKTNK